MDHWRWPRRISLDDVGIRQKSLLGKEILLRYEELDSIGVIASAGKTIVGGGGIQIEHTQFHYNRVLFVKTLEERTGKKAFVGGF